METVVYTGGTFDIVHAGHVNFLRQCSRLGRVVVGLNTDEFVLNYKGAGPVFHFDERKKQLLALGYVSEVVANIGNEDSKPAIQAVGPSVIAIGTDWVSRDYYAQMGFSQDWLDKNNITLVYIPYYQGVSTSEIKKRIYASKKNT